MNFTLDYYNQNAETFAAGTREADMHAAQDRFLALLQPGASVLDFGCGSGRDTRYFLERGLRVTAVDGSRKLCSLASAYTGIEVKQMLFQDLDEVEAYDGIWACASILHLPKAELQSVLIKLSNALKTGGIIYTSFKYGTFEGERRGRYFTDLTEETFLSLTAAIPALTPESIWLTGDVREGRSEEKWLNVMMRKREKK